MFHKDKGGKFERRSECKACRGSDPITRYKSYRRDASRRNLDFKISLADFKKFQNEPCYYCGKLLKKIRLDRVDNDLGYIDKNLVSCCHMCNSFKHVFEEKHFLDHVSKIYNYQRGKKDE